MSTKDTLIRSFMAGAILALTAVFAISITVSTGSLLLGAVLFPLGFCMLYLMGFDLLTGVFVLCPLALINKRPGAMISTSLSGKVISMWVPIKLFFYEGLEHSVVNMVLFPSNIILGRIFR